MTLVFQNEIIINASFLFSYDFKLIQKRKIHIHTDTHTFSLSHALRHTYTHILSIRIHKSKKIYKFIGCQTVVEGYPKASFSIVTTRCKSEHYSFLWIALLTLDPDHIILNVKREGIKYHFMRPWYDSTWDWTPVSRTTEEHSNHSVNWPIYIYVCLCVCVCVCFQKLFHIYIYIYIYTFVRVCVCEIIYYILISRHYKAFPYFICAIKE